MSSFTVNMDKLINMKIIGYRVNADWCWDVTEDTCAICYTEFDMQCTSCSVPGKNCPPAFGKCGHHFHAHCIKTWIAQADSVSGQVQNRRGCPMCRSPWRYRDDDQARLLSEQVSYS